MKWQEISITTTEYMQDAVANIFYDVGAGGVVIEDPNVVARYLEEKAWDYFELPEEMLQAENVVIKGYLPMDEKLPDRMEDLTLKLEALREHFDDYFGTISTSQILEKDWANAWKAYYKPHKAGERIVVIPSWENYDLQDDEIPIYLDPGMAFGIGSHPTTELCLKAQERYLKQGDYSYDIGTGSGILAIAHAKLGARRVLARDLDSVAVRMATENVARNNVSNIVTVEQGDLLDGITEPAHLISANIIADTILILIKNAYELLYPGGILISSGIITERSDEVQRELMHIGFDLVEIMADSGWVAVVAQRK